MAINTTTLKRVRDRVGVNLLSIMDREAGLLERLSTDPILLADVLFVLVEDEAKAHGVTDEDFGRAWPGTRSTWRRPPCWRTLSIFSRVRSGES